MAEVATVTTLEPLTDTSYVLQLAVYRHSIDFGTEGYANLVELAALQARVAADLGVGSAL